MWYLSEHMSINLSFYFHPKGPNKPFPSLGDQTRFFMIIFIPWTPSVALSAGKMFLLENNTIDIGEVDVGRRAIQDVPPGQLHSHSRVGLSWLTKA